MQTWHQEQSGDWLGTRMSANTQDLISQMLPKKVRMGILFKFQEHVKHYIQLKSKTCADPHLATQPGANHYRVSRCLLCCSWFHSRQLLKKPIRTIPWPCVPYAICYLDIVSNSQMMCCIYRTCTVNVLSNAPPSIPLIFLSFFELFKLRGSGC